MRKGLVLFCSLLAVAVLPSYALIHGRDGSAAKAGPDPQADPDNYCYQPAAWEGIEQLRREAPNDPLVIRMYAMRKGICALIEEGKITRDQGAGLFELERSRAIIERQQDEARRKREVGA